MKLICIEGGKGYLKSLGSLKKKKKGKKITEVTDFAIKLVENAPYVPGRLSIDNIKKRYLRVTKKKCEEDWKVKIGGPGRKAIISLLWSFGLLDVRILDNYWYIRKTELASLLEKEFGDLDRFLKLKTFLLAGLLVDTPARFVYRCTLFGCDDYKGVKGQILGYLTTPESDTLVEGLLNLLESIKIVEENQAIEGKRKYVGLLDAIFYGLSGIYANVKEGSGKLTIEPAFSELRALYEIDEKTSIGSDYGINISPSILKKLKEAKPKQLLSPDVQDSLIKLLKEKREVINSDLRLIYGV